MTEPGFVPKTLGSGDLFFTVLQCNCSQLQEALLAPALQDTGQCLETFLPVTTGGC